MAMNLITVFLLVLVCLDNASSRPDGGDPEQGRKTVPGNIFRPSVGEVSDGWVRSRPSAGRSSGWYSNRPSAGRSSADLFSNRPAAGRSSADLFSNRPAAGRSSADLFSNRPAAGRSSADLFSNRPAAGRSSSDLFSNRPAAGRGSADWFSNNNRQIPTCRHDFFPGNIHGPSPPGGSAGMSSRFSSNGKICPEGTAFQPPSNDCRSVSTHRDDILPGKTSRPISSGPKRGGAVGTQTMVSQVARKGCQSGYALHAPTDECRKIET